MYRQHKSIILWQLTWNQSMVQQLTKDGNFLNLFRKESPIGLIANTTCSWSLTLWQNMLNKATGEPSVWRDFSLCLKKKPNYNYNILHSNWKQNSYQMRVSFSCDYLDASGPSFTKKQQNRVAVIILLSILSSYVMNYDKRVIFTWSRSKDGRKLKPESCFT